MEKEPDYNDIVLREYPPIFRDATRITDHDLGILEISIHGEIEITAKDLEQMKKLGYIYRRTNVYPCIPKSLDGYLDIQSEDDLSDFLVTSITFRYYEAPTLENGGESDRQALELQRESKGE